jgi:hypothetical protein
MHFVCALSQAEPGLQTECPHVIFIPPALESDAIPWRSAWRWGERTLNVACLLCSRVYEYSSRNSSWEWVGSAERLNAVERLATHLLSAPCDTPGCRDLVEVLVVADRDLKLTVDSKHIGDLWVWSARCRKGHKAAFHLGDRSSITIGEWQDS